MEAPSNIEMQEWSEKILEEVQNTQKNLEKTRNQAQHLKSNLKKFQMMSGIWGGVAALIIMAAILTGSIFKEKNEPVERNLVEHVIIITAYPE